MKSPKGFGKKYFSFASILAFSVLPKIQGQRSLLASLLFNKNDESTTSEEDDPPLDVLESLVTFTPKPCHCNCVFKLKSKLTLLYNTYIPRCVYYTVCFAFRRSGIHPPTL